MDYKALMQAHEKNLDQFEKDTGLIGPDRVVPPHMADDMKTNTHYRQGAWDVWVKMMQQKPD